VEGKAKQCTTMSATFYCVSEVILSSVVPKLCSIQQDGIIDHTVRSRGNQFESRLRNLLAIAIDNCLLVYWSVYLDSAVTVNISKSCLSKHLTSYFD